MSRGGVSMTVFLGLLSQPNRSSKVQLFSMSVLAGIRLAPIHWVICPALVATEVP